MASVWAKSVVNLQISAVIFFLLLCLPPGGGQKKKEVKVKSKERIFSWNTVVLFVKGVCRLNPPVSFKLAGVS